MKKYSLFELGSLGINLIKTKLTLKNARLIRFPIDLRGKSKIIVGKGFTTGRGCRIEAISKNNNTIIKIGKNVQINDYVHITGTQLVEIRENVLIASKVYISDCSHGSYRGKWQSNPSNIVKDRQLKSKPVIISENVWLGENVAILPGVILGKNTIVGANSVVTKSYGANLIIAGNPSKIIKRYNFKTKKWERTDEKGEFLNEN